MRVKSVNSPCRLTLRSIWYPAEPTTLTHRRPTTPVPSGVASRESGAAARSGATRSSPLEHAASNPTASTSASPRRSEVIADVRADGDAGLVALDQVEVTRIFRDPHPGAGEVLPAHRELEPLRHVPAR